MFVIVGGPIPRQRCVLARMLQEHHNTMAMSAAQRRKTTMAAPLTTAGQRAMAMRLLETLERYQRTAGKTPRLPRADWIERAGLSPSGTVRALIRHMKATGMVREAGSTSHRAGRGFYIPAGNRK